MTTPLDQPSGDLADEAEAEAPTLAPDWLTAFLPRRDRTYLASVTVIAVLTSMVLLWRAPTVALWPALLGSACFGAVVSAGDAVTRRIPNKVNACAAASALPLLALAQSVWPGSLLRAAIGAVAAFAVYFALWLISPAGMGMGDVKLAPYLGAYLAYFGWASWWQGIVYGFLVQGVVVGLGLLTRRLRAGSSIAHGPAMCVGVAIAVWRALGA